MDISQEYSSLGSNTPLVLKDGHQKSNGYKVFSNEVRDFFKKLESWREESQIELSNIISYHSNSINQSIDDLTEEVSDLKAQLSVTKTERNNLIETVNSLSGKIWHLNDRLKDLQYLPEETLDQDTLVVQPPNTEQQAPNIDNTAEEYGDIENQSIQQHNKYQVTEQDYMEEFTVGLTDVDVRNNETENLDVAKDEVEEGHKHDRENVKSSKRKEMPMNKSKKRKTDWKRHRKYVHTIGEKKFKCEKCPYSTAERAMLTPHWLRCHIKEVHKKIRDTVCGECGYAASEKSKLKQHTEEVHNNDRYHVCGKCGCVASCKSKLKRHIEEVHMKIRKHVCGECGYAASRKNILRRHIEAVHENIRNKVCEDCGYATAYKIDLKRHREAFHKL